MVGKTAMMAAHVAALVSQGQNVALAKGDKLVVIDEASFADEFPNASEMPLPRRLTNKIGHPDYRPDFMRVGVKINGEERNDINWYDVDALRYDCIRVKGMSATSIEPFWRYPETRQQRRARERWERGRG